MHAASFFRVLYIKKTMEEEPATMKIYVIIFSFQIQILHLIKTVFSIEETISQSITKIILFSKKRSCS